ncbi:hypothetical protein C8F04DRAFT_1266335 [Mycena alexandri]|uniref:Uncharacterized protein n=1 Tax=Mycena alexandri TaxID=1745969 RepID=A0AAD6SJK5_9AGAR|nr:hypothetical protein C8F04DRAFT_1266335 [Mycena alexandri]
MEDPRLPHCRTPTVNHTSLKLYHFTAPLTLLRAGLIRFPTVEPSREISGPYDSLADAKLPPDLERLIFETAARLHPTIIPKLVLVAWRVKNWLEPVLYRVLFVTSSQILHPMHQFNGFHVFNVDILLIAIDTNPPGFLRRLVRSVLIEDTTRSKPFEIQTVLAACGDATSVCMDFAPGPLLPEVAAMRSLCRLRISAGTLLATDSHIARPLFPHLTHLELLEAYLPNNRSSWALDADDVYIKLPRFPNLTHVAFNTAPHNAVFAKTVHDDRRLRCIVFLVSRPVVLGAASPFLHDRRFICVQQDPDPRADWLRGADGGEDFWKRAEAFIEARHKGSIDPSEYNNPHPNLWDSVYTI